MKRFVYLLSLFFISIKMTPASPPVLKLEEIAYSQQWLRLGHYKKNLFGGHTSEVDGPGFFLSKEGKYDPLKELQATIEAFGRQAGDDHPQCKFPQRYVFVKEALKLNYKDQKCKNFEEWIDSIAPLSATLVFANSYPNNPASTFGHTFLKIISKKTSRLQRGDLGGDRLDILDYAVNYAAYTEESFGLFYAIKGMTGGYSGVYDLAPYYMKIREYSDGESRDLWEYKLDLNEEQTRRMLTHLWELGGADVYFNYFFLDENCSYHLLTLLEVARLDWNLTNQFNFYLSPVESVKILNKIPGAIVSVKHRPSLHKQVMKRLHLLNTKQRLAFYKIKNYQLEVSTVNDAAVLEAVLQYLFYKKREQENKLDERDNKIYRQIFIQRARLGKANSPAELDDYQDISPHLSHESMQLGVVGGLENGGQFAQFNWRLALHDLKSSDVGFAPFSQVEVGNFKFRYVDDEQKLFLDELLFMDIVSLIPVDSFNHDFSWAVRAALQRARDLSGDRSLFPFVEGRVGYASSIFSSADIAYILGGVQLEYNHQVKNYIRGGPNLTAGTIFSFGSLKFQLDGKLVADLMQDDRQKYFIDGNSTLAWSFSKNWDVRFNLQNIWRSKKSSLNYYQQQFILNYYY